MALEGMNEFFNVILDPIFSPLLRLPYLLSIVVIAFIISFLIILAYKRFTNQSLMKDLKEEIKELQKQMKELRKNPQEMMKVQKRSMDVNMKYMMHSMRPMLITFIPIIIVFAWLNTHMAYYPLVQDQEFSVLVEFEESAVNATIELAEIQDITVLNERSQAVLDSKANFVLKGDPGEYTLMFNYKDEFLTKDIIITDNLDGRVYKNPVKVIRNSDVKKIIVNNKKIKAFEGVPVFSSIPWIKGFGWLGSYILFSIVFSMALRKLLKVY